MTPSSAIVRGVPDTFDEALVMHGSAPLDVVAARSQHLDYCARLQNSGLDLVSLPVDNAYPDSLFVEDVAVIVGERAVITRPGAESRRGEVAAIVPELESRMASGAIAAPGTLDGGDVMVMGDRVFVGVSSRTNPAGVAQLTRLVAETHRVIPVPVSHVLHLKSAVLPIDAETVVVTPGCVDEGLFEGLRILYEDDTERNRFSCLPLPDGTILTTAAAPRTSEMVASLGQRIDPIDVSQIQAADGGLTCMSVLLP